MTVDIPIVADCTLALSAINRWLDGKGDGGEHAVQEQLAPWRRQIADWQAAHPLAYTDLLITWR